MQVWGTSIKGAHVVASMGIMVLVRYHILGYLDPLGYADEPLFSSVTAST